MATTTHPVLDLSEPRLVNRMAVAKPTSWDEATRTFDLIISTQADVGDGIVLIHTAEALRTPSRPVPLGIDHSYKSKDVWGSISEIRFEMVDGVPGLVGRGKVDDEDSEAVRVALPRLRDGSARFSVGARAYDIKEVETARSWEYHAIDWELIETSLVVAGQDAATIMRSSDTSVAQAPPMTVKNTAASASEANTESTESTTPATEPNTSAPVAPAATVERAAAPAPAAASGDGSTAELERSAADVRRERDILRACHQAGIPTDKTDELLASGKPYQECVKDIFTVMRAGLSQSTAGHPVGGMTVTRDQGDTIVRGITDALSFRLNTIKEPTDFGRKFMRKRSLDLLESFLVSRGVNVENLTPNQIIARAFHSTSDFPLILADVANKRLMGGYEEEPQTWQAFCTRRDLTDFKPHNNVQLQGRMTTTKTLEGGEYKGMSMVEGKSTWSLATYTGKLLWTRQMIINDDLNAFEKVIMLAGRGCRITESDIVWALLTTGAITGGQTYGGGATAGIDGAALFAQSHSNTGGGAIGIAGMNTGRVAMGKQTDIAGNKLNLRPAFLLVPTSLATTAEQFVYAPNYTPAKATGDDGPNVFTNKVQVIEEDRLEDRSAANWFLVTNPSRMETIEYGYLAGEPGPNITVTDRRDPDGAEMLVRMDFGAAVQDFRGFYRSTGA